MQKGVYGILFLAVAIYIFVTALQCRKRKEAIAGVTGAVCLFSALNVLFNSITLLSNNPLLMSVSFSLQFVCIDLLLFFLLEYTTQLAEFGRLKPVYKIIPILFFAVDSIILLANPWTNWAVEYKPYDFNGDLYFEFVPKLWYYIHLNFAYLVLAAVFVVLLVKMLRTPLVYAGRYVLKLGALVLVVVFNCLFLFTTLKIDVSCVIFALSAYAAYHIALKYRPKLFRKHARYLMANKIQEPLLLFDINDKLADYNKEAAEKFELQEADVCKMTREHFETDILQLTYEEKPDISINREVTLRKEYAVIHYRLTLQNLKSNRGLNMGTMYVFQDVTKQKMMYNALENMSSYDPLTGFYSGRAFETKLAEWDKEPEEYIVAICNVAGLKLLNAFYERKTGSDVIQKMSEELRNVLPEDGSGLLCR